MEKVSLPLLLVTIAAIQNSMCGTSAQSGDGNDISEASGSGMRELPTRPSCHVPADSNFDRISVNLTEEEREELMLEGRCYLACTIEHFMPKDQATRKYNPVIPYWPYVTVEKNCSISQNVHECIRGCVLRSKTPNLNSRICGHTSSRSGPQDGGKCRVNCKNECGGSLFCDNPDPHDPWISPWCELSCHAPSCQNGCNTPLSVITSAENLPKDPIAHTPPIIAPVYDSAGQFMINLSPASPQPMRIRGQPTFNSSSIAPVAFLLRIELVETRTFSFMWAAEPFTQMDLADYACEEVQVSFAVTNRQGLSQFSEPVQIMVHGVNTPHPPRNLQVSSEIDRRIGFFGHVILNISWEAPENDYYLDYYSIAISSVACRTHAYVEWNDTFISNDTFITLMATTTTKNTSPLTDCTYNIQVSSVGQAGSSNPLPETYHTPEFDPKNIGFQCERLWNSQKYFFSFNLTWTLPDFLRDGNVIDGFHVSYLMKEESGQSVMFGIRPDIQLPQNSSMIFSEIIAPNDTSIDGRPYNTPQHSDSMTIFLFEMRVIWNRDHPSSEHVYNCTASTLSPAPTDVENVTVESYCFSNDSHITLSFTWTPPSNFNGEPANYDVCVGSDALEPTDIDSEIPDGHFCTSDSLLPQLTNATVTLLHVKISSHLYLQIRASNVFVSGHWSRAYEIPLSSVGIGCDLNISTDSISSVSGINTSTDSISSVSGINTSTDSVPSVSGINTSTDSISSVNVGIIVGSSLGGILLVILLIFCMCVGVWYIRMLRQRKKLRKITEGFSDDPMFSRGPKTLYLRNPTDLSLKSPLDEWEIPASEVIMEKLLGEGAFGEVYKGIIKCPIVNPKVRALENTLCTPVAIKLLKLSAKGNERKDFLSEIEMMKKVAEGQNSHVVGLLGCVTIQEPLCLITEFVKYGDLLSYLRMNRRMCTETNTEEDDENDAYLELGNVSPVDLISFAYQIASGMEYLSSLGIVHRDLASRNILVDEGKVLKITDFGMSRETDEIYVQKRTGRVPLKWMAIESIIAREFTSASDVWSFGITLWEIGTLGGFPYPSIQNEDLLPLLKGGYRMEKPDNCSPEVYDIMLMCWNEQPQKRPKFTELRARFDAMLLAEGKDAYIDLRINNDKPYYRLDTAATAAANSVRLSPNPNRLSCMPSPGSGINSRSSSKECSPNPLHTPNFSPSHKSQASCCSSAHASPRKSDFGRGGLALSTSSFGRHSPNHNVRERTQTIASNGERRGEHARENGRPLSLLLPRDHERERRERQNPYVDEPSRAAQASMLAPPNGDISHAAARRGSDGAIEMNYLRSDGPQSQGAGIEIKITSDKN